MDTTPTSLELHGDGGATETTIDHDRLDGDESGHMNPLVILMNAASNPDGMGHDDGQPRDAETDICTGVRALAIPEGSAQVKREPEEYTSTFARAVKSASACSICLEDLEVGSLAETACYHIFCAECIDDWRTNGHGDRGECPLCRGPIEHDLTSECDETPCSSSTSTDMVVAGTEDGGYPSPEDGADADDNLPTWDAKGRTVIRKLKKIVDHSRRTRKQQRQSGNDTRGFAWKSDMAEDTRDFTWTSDKVVADKTIRKLQQWSQVLLKRSRMLAAANKRIRRKADAAARAVVKEARDKVRKAAAADRLESATARAAAKQARDAARHSGVATGACIVLAQAAKRKGAGKKKAAPTRRAPARGRAQGVKRRVADEHRLSEPTAAPTTPRSPAEQIRDRWMRAGWESHEQRLAGPLPDGDSEPMVDYGPGDDGAAPFDLEPPASSSESVPWTALRDVYFEATESFVIVDATGIDVRCVLPNMTKVKDALQQDYTREAARLLAREIATRVRFAERDLHAEFGRKYCENVVRDARTGLVTPLTMLGIKADGRYKLIRRDAERSAAVILRPPDDIVPLEGKSFLRAHGVAKLALEWITRPPYAPADWLNGLEAKRPAHKAESTLRPRQHVFSPTVEVALTMHAEDGTAMPLPNDTRPSLRQAMTEPAESLLQRIDIVLLDMDMNDVSQHMHVGKMVFATTPTAVTVTFPFMGITMPSSGGQSKEVGKKSRYANRMPRIKAEQLSSARGSTTWYHMVIRVPGCDSLWLTNSDGTPAQIVIKSHRLMDVESANGRSTNWKKGERGPYACHDNCTSSHVGAEGSHRWLRCTKQPKPAEEGPPGVGDAVDSMAPAAARKGTPEGADARHNATAGGATRTRPLPEAHPLVAAGDSYGAVRQPPRIATKKPRRHAGSSPTAEAD